MAQTPKEKIFRFDCFDHEKVTKYDFVVELRSDAMTKSTEEMRKAMTISGVGYDVQSEDPTVNELEEKMDQIFGKEAALFLPSGTMCNLIADSKTTDTQNNGEQVRDKWDNQIEFLLSCIAMSVGLGNIWRFPFKAYENGGGAFLIPYLIVLFFIGKPVYYLELAQMVATFCTTYYTFVLALAVFYFFSSFKSTLPWSQCDNEWAGPEYICSENLTEILYQNGTATSISIPERYFLKFVVNEKADINSGIGVPDWRLVGCLLFSWVTICLVIIKGVKSSGKAAYFTALFPYVILITLLIRGCTLPGAWVGIKFFIEPQWEKLYETKVWYEAINQCFFSLSTGFGSLAMLASYNPFRHNIYRDAMIITVMDTCTSLLAGCTIFAILGSLATSLNTDVSKVAHGGPGLAFISYPMALSSFGWAPQFFAAIFFLMLFTLGVGSATALISAVVTLMTDEWEKVPRWAITIAVCVSGFLISIMYTTPGGLFMITLIDHHGTTFVVYFIVIIEVFAIAWIYGLKNFCDDIEFMIDIKVGIYWKFCWGYFVPISLTAILIYQFVTMEELKHNGESYPTIAIVFGWLLSCTVVSSIPLVGLFTMYKLPFGSLKERFLLSIKPKKNWGPKNKKDRDDWIVFKQKLY